MKFIFSLCFLFAFFNFTLAQAVTKPILINTWISGEDFGEFIYHTVDSLQRQALETKGIIIVRICTNQKMTNALVSYSGVSFSLPSLMEQFGFPLDKVFYARYSKCGNASTQYWIVPQNAKLECDEIIPAKNVTAQRFLVEEENKREFSKIIKDFISVLKNNITADGFILRNYSKRNNQRIQHNVQKVLLQIRRENISQNRIQIVPLRLYMSLYPELITIQINRNK